MFAGLHRFYFQEVFDMNAPEELIHYYNTHDEGARLESRHGKIEWLTTIRYIEKYSKPGMKILEIGAGTGKYSHFFAQKGYHVDAVELIEHNIEIFKQLTKENEPVTITQGNALDLSLIDHNIYDITLLLGPMYHLYTTKDQLQALSEAIRVTKKGGIIFAAYCNSDMTMYQCFLKKEMLYRQIAADKIDLETFELFSEPEDVFQLYRKKDVDTLMSHFRVTRLHYVGTDMLSRLIKKTINEMDEETYALYLRYHFSICEREDMIGATNHMLDIFRKE